MSDQAQPVFSIDKLYVKDLSLEVPGAPQVFLERESPQIDVQLHTQARPLDPGLFEVVLTATITAKVKDKKTLFLVEAAQAGIFQIRNVPDSDMGPVLGISCPNILFPYVREVVSDVIIRAGFPSVILSPVNFEGLYHEQMKQRQAAPQPAAQEPAGQP